LHYTVSSVNYISAWYSQSLLTVQRIFRLTCRISRWPTPSDTGPRRPLKPPLFSPDQSPDCCSNGLESVSLLAPLCCPEINRTK